MLLNVVAKNNKYFEELRARIQNPKLPATASVNRKCLLMFGSRFGLGLAIPKFRNQTSVYPKITNREGVYKHCVPATQTRHISCKVWLVLGSPIQTGHLAMQCTSGCIVVYVDPYTCVYNCHVQ